MIPTADTSTPGPAKAAGILKRSCQYPLADGKLREYLTNRGLLDSSGQLATGAKLLCCGTGPAILDLIAALGRFMTLFECCADDPLGYTVSQTARSRYRNTLHVLHHGDACGTPRLVSDPTWPTQRPAIAHTRHLHALHLHSDGSRVMTSWAQMETAAVARATGKTPDQVRAIASKDQSPCHRPCHDANADDGEPDNTSALALLQRTHLGTLLGYGMSPDLPATNAEMQSCAPITWNPGIATVRKQKAAALQTNSAFATPNPDAARMHRNRMKSLTSVPPVVQAMLPKLCAAGIARHLPQKPSEVHPDPGSHGLSSAGQTYDGLLVLPDREPGANLPGWIERYVA